MSDPSSSDTLCLDVDDWECLLSRRLLADLDVQREEDSVLSGDLDPDLEVLLLSWERFLRWCELPSGIETLLPPSLTSNLKGSRHPIWYWTVSPEMEGDNLDDGLVTRGDLLLSTRLSLCFLPLVLVLDLCLETEAETSVEDSTGWLSTATAGGRFSFWGTAGCRVRPVTGVTGVRWAATDWDCANFIRSINSLMVNLGSDACCPGAPAAAAGWFMIGTWGINTDWVGRFVPTTWKYVPSWSTNVLGFHNTGFMSWAWSWFTRWGPSWSMGGNASPWVRRNPRLSSSSGAVATPWWPVQGPRDLPSPGGVGPLRDPPLPDGKRYQLYWDYP